MILYSVVSYYKNISSDFVLAHTGSMSHYQNLQRTSNNCYFPYNLRGDTGGVLVQHGI